MQLLSYEKNGMRIIRVDADRIDAAAAIEFKELLREMIDKGDKSIILDLAQVEFIDSSGLGAIVSIGKLLGEDRALELAQLTPPVSDVFELTHLDRIFTIHANLDDDISGWDTRHAS